MKKLVFSVFFVFATVFSSYSVEVGDNSLSSGNGGEHFSYRSKVSDQEMYCYRELYKTLYSRWLKRSRFEAAVAVLNLLKKDGLNGCELLDALHAIDNVHFRRVP